MVLELLIAAAVAAGSVEAPDIPPSGLLPHGGRACLIIARCDARPCVVPVRRGRPPLPMQLRCPKAPLRAVPRVIPATG